MYGSRVEFETQFVEDILTINGALVFGMAQDLDPSIARTDDFKISTNGTMNITYDEYLASQAAGMLGELQEGQGLLEGVVNDGSGEGGNSSLAGSISRGDPYEVYGDIEAILAAEGTLDPDTTNLGLQ